jgi:hypothetical protein
VPKDTYSDGVLWNPIIPIEDEVNPPAGTYWIAYTSRYPAPSFNGTGTVFTMTFRVKYHPPQYTANITLELYSTDLAASDASSIPHTTQHGTVILHALAARHDVAIVGVHPWKTIVGQGYSMRINVTLANQGDFTETFNVTLYANTTTIKTQEITLTSGNPTTITFTWNTTGFAKGNYTISAYAIPVTGETDIINNNCTDGSVLITKVGDLGSRVGSTNKFFVCDGQITSTDLNLFLQCYKATAPTDAMYLADLGSRVNSTNKFFVCDGSVTSTDLNLFLQCYKGQGPPDP